MENINLEKCSEYPSKCELSAEKNSSSQNTFIGIHLKEEIIDGNKEAFATVYDLYIKNLYAYGSSITPNIDLIEDAMHDVFVDMYMHRENLKNVRNLKQYIMSAFRHRLLFLLKKNKQNREITEEDMSGFIEKDFQDTWIEQEEESEKSQLVKQLFSRLNSHQQEALHLRFIEGLSYSDISEMMQINHQSVKNLIQRAIKKLKSEFAFSAVFFINTFLFSIY